MDSMDTWPAPVTVADKDFDRQVMQQLRRAPNGAPAPSSDHAGSVPAAEPDAAGASETQTDAMEGAAKGAAGAGVLSTREKLATSLVLVIPVVSALIVVLSWMRYAASGNAVWLAVIAVVLVLAALSWMTTLKRAFARAQGHLAARLPGVIGYGVGVIRSVDVESPLGEDGVAATVTAELDVAVNPVSGPRFHAKVTAVYHTADIERLTPGAHGPVRYLRSDPTHTLGIETRLDEARVQEIYRAAALN